MPKGEGPEKGGPRKGRGPPKRAQVGKKKSFTKEPLFNP